MTPPRTQSVHPLELLDKAPLRERVAALSEALRVAPEADREPIALRLFELGAAGRLPDRAGPLGPIELVAGLPARWRARHAEDAMLAIVRSWDQVPESARGLIAGLSRDRWIRVAARAAAEPDAESRRSVARFTEDTADPGLAATVAGLLQDEQQPVRLQADRALLRLVMTLVPESPAELLGEEFAAVSSRPVCRLTAAEGVLDLERVELCRQISEAAWSYADHRCRSPLIGALLLLDRVEGGALERPVADRLRRLLNERHHPSHTPLKTTLKRTPSPLFRERALRWVVIDPIAASCIERLSSADSVAEHEMVLSRAYLALRPRRAERLRGVRSAGDRTDSPIPTPATQSRLTAESRRGLVRFVQVVGLEDEARRAVIEPTLADPDPRVRLAGAHAAHPADLTDFTFDPDEGVARSAANRWSTAGVPAPVPGTPGWTRRTDLSRVLSRSPHACVRVIAEEEHDRLDAFAGSPASRLAARRMLERDPVGFVRAVREHLRDDAACLNALMLIRSLKVAARFEMDLMDLAANAPGERARATAVAALGVVESESARRIVRSALAAPDPRVRSNAVEAVRVDPGVLIEFKDDSSHRVRASAVRRVLSTPATPNIRDAAADALGRMLVDDRSSHRLSAAWAAERVVRPELRDTLGQSWRALVKRVIDAADHDTDDRVRWRAARCARRLDPANAGAPAA